MRSPRHLVTGVFLSDTEGDRYVLSLWCDGEVVQKFITVRVDVILAANHLLDHSRDPEGLGRSWCPHQPDAVVLLVELDTPMAGAGDMTIGDVLVTEVDHLGSILPA
jgi:hypothetical protein